MKGVYFLGLFLLFMMQYGEGIFGLPFPYGVPKKSSQRLSSYPYISGDSFRSICDHIFDETDHGFEPELVERGDLVFLKNDTLHIPYFFSKFHSKINNPYILIIHNGAYSIPSLSSVRIQLALEKPASFNFESYLDDEKILMVFAQNVDKVHKKLQVIPVGIPNRYWPTGNILNYHNYAKGIKIEKIDKAYLNVSIQTNPQRKKIIDHLINKEFIVWGDNKPHIEYLAEMSTYRFVISPPGNGLDCHRHWETLLVGSIPIMFHSIIDELFLDLPVIFIDSWEQINQKNINEKYSLLNKQNCNTEKLYMDYWINLIKSYQKQYI